MRGALQQCAEHRACGSLLAGEFPVLSVISSSRPHEPRVLVRLARNRDGLLILSHADALAHSDTQPIHGIRRVGRGAQDQFALHKT